MNDVKNTMQKRLTHLEEEIQAMTERHQADLKGLGAELEQSAGKPIQKLNEALDLIDSRCEEQFDKLQQAVSHLETQLDHLEKKGTSKMSHNLYGPPRISYQPSKASVVKEFKKERDGAESPPRTPKKPVLMPKRTMRPAKKPSESSLNEKQTKMIEEIIETKFQTFKTKIGEILPSRYEQSTPAGGTAHKNVESIMIGDLSNASFDKRPLNINSQKELNPLETLKDSGRNQKSLANHEASHENQNSFDSRETSQEL